MKLAFLLCTVAALPAICAAQTVVAPISSTRNDAPTGVEPSAASMLERGRVLLSVGNSKALDVLRGAAKRELNAFDMDKSAPFKSETLQLNAVRACLWWGKAAQKVGERDEAIEAWTQSLRAFHTFSLNGQTSFLNVITPDEREVQALLNAELLNGLPLRARFETLQTLSSRVAKNAWETVVYPFRFPDFGAPINHTEIEYSKSATMREFLVTSGTLTLPIARTPSLYKSFDATILPDTLKMTRVVVGYARDSSGNDNDIWRQKVRVLYAPIDDAERPRAEKIAAQWLRVSTLFDRFLNLHNVYSSDGVTTIWLTRQSGEWPQNAPNENWNAGAWIDSAPDQMILFRSSQARPEAEWLRETAHEYSHIAFAPFAGFAQPLEPFGNGRLGETILMVWAAQSPAAFFAPEEIASAQKNCNVHLSRHAIPALESWRALDPTQPLSSKGDANALKQLIGLALQIERVYGAQTLLHALDFAAQGKTDWRRNGIEYSMSRNAAKKPPVLRAADLLRGFHSAMVFPSDNAIWLRGALRVQNVTGEMSTLSPPDLARRAPLTLKRGDVAAGWIYFPAKTALKISVDGAALKIGGDWKVETARDGLTISNVKRSGWQKIVLHATRDVLVGDAHWQNAAK